jgi:uncharacterized protein (TIGR03118 family)
MKTMQQSLNRLVLLATAAVVVASTSQRVLADGVNNFTQTNLVSDIPGLAKTTDPDLVNPWGVSFGPTSPFWVSDNRTGVATLYNGAGDKIPLVVSVPPPNGGTPPSAPTGQVFNPSAANFGGSHFIFATEDGTISAWTSGTSAVLMVDNSFSGAVYKGLAIGNTSEGSRLFATDFHNGTINVFGTNFAPVSPSGSFTDPNLPAGYAPFNIQNIGGKLYVTYAVQDAAKHDDVSGAGNGIVDVFDLEGNLIQRLISNGSLNSPWGMAIAPAGFGSFGNDLLVGNFGDGTINVFDPITGTFIMQLDGANGLPIVNLGLWDLTFGNGGNGGSTSDLYFTAGIPGDGHVEDHGLFGSLAPTPTPEPTTLTLIGSGLFGLIAYRRRRTNSIV